MRAEKKHLTNFSKNNPTPLLFEFGLSPEEIKREAIDTLSEYFTNINSLESLQTGSLYNTYLIYLTLKRDEPNNIKYIKDIISIFNKALIIDEAASIQGYLTLLPDMQQAISRYWNLYNNQIDKEINKLPVEDFLDESLRTIGYIIEGISKPFFHLISYLNKISKSKFANIDKIKDTDLGIIIDELINSAYLNNLLITKPFNLQLHKWRNIAYHHNSKVINRKITCWYKSNGINNEFRLNKKQLFEVTKYIYSVYKIIRLCETIFQIDHKELIRNYITPEHQDKIITKNRKEIDLLELYSIFSSQGFKTLDLSYNKKLATLKLQDMNIYEPYLKRAIHTSQFLYTLWIFTNSSKLKIEYYINNSKKFFISQIDANAFSNATNEDDIFKSLVNFELVYINNNFTQDIDPFKEYRQQNDEKHWRSQLGDLINEESFVKQFTLSVFNNYLVLTSEGFKEEDIKITVGNDGSLAYTDKSKSTALFHTPAFGISEKLQKNIIDLLGITIDLYKSHKLSTELVEQARLNNNYYRKKALIKDQIAKD